MKYLKFEFIAIGVLLLAGCGTSNYESSKEYQEAVSHSKSLAIPSDLNKSAIEDVYQVPKVNNGMGSSDVSILPPGSKNH